MNSSITCCILGWPFINWCTLIRQRKKDFNRIFDIFHTVIQVKESKLRYHREIGLVCGETPCLSPHVMRIWMAVAAAISNKSAHNIINKVPTIPLSPDLAIGMWYKPIAIKKRYQINNINKISPHYTTLLTVKTLKSCAKVWTWSSIIKHFTTLKQILRQQWQTW